MSRALVIGAGPAGLMAAEVMGQAGLSVTVAEKMPTPARKFLMAGKSGLNLANAVPVEEFTPKFWLGKLGLATALAAFGPGEVRRWAEGLGQEIFEGSTGRLFPRTMKASPLLRAWLARLAGLGVDLKTRWDWQGWAGTAARFSTADGHREVEADVIVVATGGASWPRLGSDGAALAYFADVAPLAPANAGLRLVWSDKMAPHLGQPLKAVRWRAGDLISSGEAVVVAEGLEGGGIYTLTPAIRAGAGLRLDLVPDLSPREVARRLAKARARDSRANRLRKALGLDAVKRALLNEWGRGRDDSEAAKDLHAPKPGLAPIEKAISTAGGLRFGALDDQLMVKARPGVFAAGEMLDWEAPTGGYLLTSCLATGRFAGEAAVRFAGARAAR